MKTLNNIQRELNVPRTENFDVAYNTTYNRNLDLFGLMGGMRYNPEDLKKLFINAYLENEEYAIRNLFYLRDVRGGMGERNSFRILTDWLVENHPEKFKKIIYHIPELGRWDDILALLNSQETSSTVVEIISGQLKKDMESDSPSLMAKWLPSINTSSLKSRKLALLLSKKLNLSNKEYRQMLSSLRKKIGILETKLTNEEYDFDYSKLPSKAMHKYKSAFCRNDEIRYSEYLGSLLNGKNNINVSTLFPHEIISKYYRIGKLQDYEIKQMEAQWKAIERNSTNVNTIVVRDGSGSMYGMPLEIASALAILYSEQLNGEFKDTFITFSSHPKLISLHDCRTIKDKLDRLLRYDECTNTNIEKVYNLILNASIGVPENEQINKILIISDMEFDYGVDSFSKSTYNSVKSKYKKAGIKLPEIIYWNVEARSIHFPVTMENKVKLISGFSNSVLQNIIKDVSISPVDLMFNTLDKYKDISDEYISA